MIEPIFARYRDVLNQFFASCSEEELRHIQGAGVDGFQVKLLAEDLKRMIAYKQRGSKSMNEEFNKIMTGYYRK